MSSCEGHVEYKNLLKLRHVAKSSSVMTEYETQKQLGNDSSNYEYHGKEATREQHPYM